MFAIGFGLFVVAWLWMVFESYYKRGGLDIRTEFGDATQGFMFIAGFVLMLAGAVAWLWRVMP